MIDTKFIVRYTNALYSTPTEFCPSYNEFRDMFSYGQIKSKEWAVKELLKLYLQIDTCVIMGCWFGTLGLMIKNVFPNMSLNLIDIDPRCEKFTKNIFYDIPDVDIRTEDMYNYKIIEDLIINTSCEHIPDVKNFLSHIPNNRFILLQSNNYYAAPDHINCVDTEDAFIEQTGITKILYVGSLELPIYTRFMIIGIT